MPTYNSSVPTCVKDIKNNLSKFVHLKSTIQLSWKVTDLITTIPASTTTTTWSYSTLEAIENLPTSHHDPETFDSRTNIAYSQRFNKKIENSVDTVGKII